MTDRIKRRLAKVLALAENGVGGEKENAQAIIKRSLAKYGLKISDISAGDQAFLKETRVYYGYRSRFDKKILFQCYYKAAKKGEISYCQNSRGRKVGITASAIVHLELEAMYSYYKKLFAEEIENLVVAFVSKHELFSGVPNDEGGDPMDMDKYLKILGMMQGLGDSEFVSTKKRLT